MHEPQGEDPLDLFYRVARDVVARNPHATLEELNAALELERGRYNARPRASWVDSPPSGCAASWTTTGPAPASSASATTCPPPSCRRRRCCTMLSTSCDASPTSPPS